MNDCRKSIGWADLTWNPVTGCRHTCPYCYARKMAWRFGQETGNRKERVRVEPQWVHDIVADCRVKGIPVYVKGNVPRAKWGAWPQEKPAGRKG